tara:strand:- start:7324 stop:7536 length:213 start_codon:yes stop_codon:yes gene_type:complete
MNKTDLNNKEQKAQGLTVNKNSIKDLISNYNAVKKFLSTLDATNDKKAVETTKNAGINTTNLKTNERESN